MSHDAGALILEGDHSLQANCHCHTFSPKTHRRTSMRCTHYTCPESTEKRSGCGTQKKIQQSQEPVIRSHDFGVTVEIYLNQRRGRDATLSAQLHQRPMMLRDITALFPQLQMPRIPLGRQLPWLPGGQIPILFPSDSHMVASQARQLMTHLDRQC